MLTANYQRHFKALGKLCRMWDTATSDVTTKKALVVAMFDTIADGTVATYGASVALNPYTANVDQAISGVNAGAAAIQSTAVAMAKAYLTNPAVNFKGDLLVAGAIAAVTDPSNVALVLEGLRLEMAATGGGDNKKLTTAPAPPSTGLINFFVSALGHVGPNSNWNNIADGSADFKDSVYVVDAVI